MKKIDNKKLKKIEGGGIGWYVVLGGVITFLIGAVDGYLRPLSCNK